MSRKIMRPLIVGVVAFGLSAGAMYEFGPQEDRGAESDTEELCPSEWMDFIADGDPQAGTDPTTQTKAVVVEFLDNEVGEQQQAGFTDPNGQFHESAAFNSQDVGIAFGVGREALRGSVRVFVNPESPLCGSSLEELTVIPTDTHSPLYAEAIKPEGWQLASR